MERQSLIPTLKPIQVPWKAKLETQTQANERLGSWKLIATEFFLIAN